MTVLWTSLAPLWELHFYVCSRDSCWSVPAGRYQHPMFTLSTSAIWDTDPYSRHWPALWLLLSTAPRSV